MAERSSPPRPSPLRWVPWFVLVAAVPVGLISWMTVSAAQYRQKAWPVVQGMVHRLEDPARAKQVWERNPALHYTYPDAASFQEEVATWLPRVGPLPDQEPFQSPQAYSLGSSPSQLRVAVKGRNGAWMYLGLEGPGPFKLTRVAGEGITDLLFADERANLDLRQRDLRAKRQQVLWARFREVESHLRDERKARQLWDHAPKLHASFKKQEELLSATSPWRGPHPSLPEALEPVRESLSLSIHESDSGVKETAGYPGPEGTMLWVTWLDGELDGIHPTLEAHGH